MIRRNKNWQKRKTLGSTAVAAAAPSAPALSSSSCSTGTLGRAEREELPWIQGWCRLTGAVVGTKASLNDAPKPTRPLSRWLDSAYSTMSLHDSSKIFVEHVLHVARIQPRPYGSALGLIKNNHHFKIPVYFKLVPKKRRLNWQL